MTSLDFVLAAKAVTYAAERRLGGQSAVGSSPLSSSFPSLAVLNSDWSRGRSALTAAHVKRAQRKKQDSILLLSNSVS